LVIGAWSFPSIGNRLWRVTTSAGELLTTQTQPLCVPAGVDLAVWETRPAGELEPGDRVFCWERGELRAVSVLAVAPADHHTRVINLVLGDCEAFLANGFLARSKPPPE
jgi:hypothetical protein